MEAATRQPEVTGIGLHDHDVRAEPITQLLGAPRMRLYRDDARARCQQRLDERAVAGADVEHECARRDACVGDEPVSPGLVEPVPSPLPP